MTRDRTEETTDITTAAMIAVKKESILNPLTKWEVIRSNIALITKINSPRESMVAGRVKKTIKGFRSILRTPKTIATTSAVV